MLMLHTAGDGMRPPPADLESAALPEGIVWIDMIDPMPAERDFVARATGLSLPTRADLVEIESSSRLRTLDHVVYLSTPLVVRADSGGPLTTPLGFVLGSHQLITVRFEELNAFRAFAEQPDAREAMRGGSAGVFVGLLETIVDRIADVLEKVGADLDALSHRLFRAQPAATSPKRRQDAELREMLRRVGAGGDLASKIRDSLLGFGRIVPYVKGNAAGWVAPEIMPRLQTLSDDIASLNDYVAHLTGKVQLLLDAALGLINIEQNDTIRLLTVVSIIGIPPTLIASLYGMNFHNMPELDWSWGYEYALTLIAVSAVVPLLWFKRRGWV